MRTTGTEVPNWHTGVSATVGIENDDVTNGVPSGNAITTSGVESPQLAVGFLPAGATPPWYVSGGGEGGIPASTRVDTSDEHETNACGGTVVGSRILGGSPAVAGLVAVLLLLLRRRAARIRYGTVRTWTRER